VLASTSPEMSALGVADMALGHRTPRPTREYSPAISSDERRHRRAAWREAVERARTHELEETLR
jgi:hypothetical protein